MLTVIHKFVKYAKGLFVLERSINPTLSFIPFASIVLVIGVVIFHHFAVLRALLFLSKIEYPHFYSFSRSFIAFKWHSKV